MYDFGEQRGNFRADKNGTQGNIVHLHFISLKYLKPYNVIITHKGKYIHQYNLRKKVPRIPETDDGKPNAKTEKEITLCAFLIKRISLYLTYG